MSFSTKIYFSSRLNVQILQYEPQIEKVSCMYVVRRKTTVFINRQQKNTSMMIRVAILSKTNILYFYFVIFNHDDCK